MNQRENGQFSAGSAKFQLPFPHYGLRIGHVYYPILVSTGNGDSTKKIGTEAPEIHADEQTMSTSRSASSFPMLGNDLDRGQHCWRRDWRLRVSWLVVAAISRGWDTVAVNGKEWQRMATYGKKVQQSGKKWQEKNTTILIQYGYSRVFG